MVDAMVRSARRRFDVGRFALDGRRSCIADLISSGPDRPQ